MWMACSCIQAHCPLGSFSKCPAGLQGLVTHPNCLLPAGTPPHPRAPIQPCGIVLLLQICAAGQSPAFESTLK